MIIGIPKEIKPEEYRIAVLPGGVRQLTSRGHSLLVQKEAGLAAGFGDEDYAGAGAEVVNGPERVFAGADLIVKVKEPIEQEYGLFSEETALFCYLHSETRPTLIDLLLQKRITAIAFENIKGADGSFPLLAPMSIIAGQQAVFQGMQFLWSHHDGLGVSMVAYPGLEPPEVVVLGAGQAGFHAARVAASLGAQVALFEIDPARIRQIAVELPANVRILDIQTVPLEPYLRRAHMLINTATVPPNSSRHLVDRAMVGKMRKGSVIVDVTANLRGAIETIDHYTTHADPVWSVDGVIHYAVTNIPGAVAHTASHALSAVVLPYLLELADKGPESALRANPALLHGLTSIAGLLTWREAGLLQNRPWLPPGDALAKLEANSKA
jgi:alanine dehydrogenase